MKYFIKYILFLFIASIANYSIAQRGDRTNFFSSVINTNIKPQLFNDISFGGFNLLATNLQFSKENSLQKVVFSPLKLSSKPSFFKDTRINFSQKDNISTIGVAFGYDNTNPYNGTDRIEKIFNNLGSIPSLRPQLIGESDEDYKKFKQSFLDKLDAIRIKYMKEIAKKMFSFTVGYNISLFELIGGTKIKDANGLITNQYMTKSHNYSVDFNYGFNQDLAINLGGVYKLQRQAASAGQELVNYYGFNTSITGRIIYLQKGDELERNPDFIKSLFIPSILLGVSLETLTADGNPKFYEDNISYQYIITPSIDFKISPKSQFKLSIPIKKYRNLDANFVSTGPFVQYTLEIANTN